MQTRIVVADDERFAREGIIRVLEEEPDFLVVGEAYHGYQVVEMVKQLQPDVLLLDVQMPPEHVGGLLAFRALRKLEDLKTRILVLTKDELAILTIKEEGGNFIPKSADRVLVSAVREIAEKPSKFGLETNEVYELESIRKRFQEANLTAVDVEILSLITFETKEIAQRIKRDDRYVRDRLSNNVYARLKDQHLIDPDLPIPLWRQAEAIARIVGILKLPDNTLIERAYRH